MSEKITVLRVSARRNGYRRAGLQFGEGGAAIPLAALTSHQVKELRTDRMLSTETGEAFVLDEVEYVALSQKATTADELMALLPADFTWTRTPTEYVANLIEQLRAQMNRANGLETSIDTLQTELVGLRANNQSLRAQLDESQAALAAKPETAKAAHASGRR